MGQVRNLNLQLLERMETPRRRHRSVAINVLCVVFGTSSWLSVNGLWVELPLLVQRLPEGWALPAILTLVVQLANVGPLLYARFPHGCLSERGRIYGIMFTSTTVLLVLSQLWEVNTIVFLALVFVLALMDCCSRVTFLPYMGHFGPDALTCYFIGEGLSSLLPSLMATVQGVDDEETSPGGPLFSVTVFLYILTSISVISLGAFVLLSNKNQDMTNEKRPLLEEKSRPIDKNSEKRKKYYRSNSHVDDADSDELDYDDFPPSSPSQPQWDIVVNSVLLIFVSGLAYGIFPSIQSYSCLPYGATTYHYVVILSSVANPTVCILMLLPINSNKKTFHPAITTAMIFLVVGLGCYVFSTALFVGQSNSTSEQVMLVIAWMGLIGLLTGLKVSLASALGKMGQRGLLLTGVFTQIGSTIGVISIFLVITFTPIFSNSTTITT